MRRTLHFLLSVVAAAGSSTGCATAIGYGLGAVGDARADKVVKPLGHPEEVQGLEMGTPVELRLRDGRALRGLYQGLDRTLTEGQVSQLVHERYLPATGPGARLALTGTGTIPGELIGYGSDFVVFQEEGEPSPARVSLEHIVSLEDAEGRSVSGPRLAERLGAAQISIPVSAGLRLEQAGETTVVPYEDVVAVGRLVTPNAGKKRGLLFGAVVDAVIIATSWGQLTNP